MLIYSDYCNCDILIGMSTIDFSSESKHQGFTLVELIIVIVIIGILAAISVLAYNGVVDSAHDTTVKSDLANFAKKIEIVKTETGFYPQNSSQMTKDMGFTFTRNAYGADEQFYNLRFCANPETDNYIMYARSKSGNFFKYTAHDGLETATNTYGWGVCSQIGLSKTNPTANGLYNSDTWASWIN